MGSGEWPACADCGASEARTTFGGRSVCDRCLNDRISAQTGWPRLPDPPSVEEFRAADGRRVAIRYRLTWAPSGVIWAEAEEVGGADDGYRFEVAGRLGEAPDDVLVRLRDKVVREVGRTYLERSSGGWTLAGHEIAGRIDWSGEEGVYDEPSVVVDGRRLDWANFGRMVASFEGWEFRLRFTRGDVDSDDRGVPEAEDEDAGGVVVPLRAHDDDPAATTNEEADVSIDRVLADFLADQRDRLADSTYQGYERIVDLLRRCLNSYGYPSLEGDEAERWRETFEAGEHDAFTLLCGPERILDGYGEFLGYFMIRKVAATKQDLRAAGTVTKKLARWLADHGYVDTEEAKIAVDRAAEAGRELPRADELNEHLFDLAKRTHLPLPPTEIADEDWVEDYLPISRVEAGQLWFGDVGPIAVPKAASDLARIGWDVNVVLARTDGEWRLVEVGMVYP